MAVIRLVDTVSNFNMDINDEELLAILVSLEMRKVYLLRPGNDDYKAITINLIAQIKAALTHG